MIVAFPDGHTYLLVFEQNRQQNGLGYYYVRKKQDKHNLLDEKYAVVMYWCHMIAFGVFVVDDNDKLSIPKLHKRQSKSHVIANFSSCSTIDLSICLTSCLTTIKNHVIKYCEPVYERNGKKKWPIKNSGEILNKLKSKGFLASNLSTYDSSSLYTTFSHNLIKEKLTELIEQTFNREIFSLLNNLKYSPYLH